MLEVQEHAKGKYYLTHVEEEGLGVDIFQHKNEMLDRDSDVVGVLVCTV
mgnify:FL=1